MLVTRLWRTRTTAQKLCAIQCVCLGYYHRLRDHVPVKKLHEHTTKLCFIAVKICEKAHLLEINQALSSCLLYQHGINFFGFQEFQRENKGTMFPRMAACSSLAQELRAAPGSTEETCHPSLRFQKLWHWKSYHQTTELRLNKQSL